MPKDSEKLKRKAKFLNQLNFFYLFENRFENHL